MGFGTSKKKFRKILEPEKHFRDLEEARAALKPNQLQAGLRLGIPKGSLSQFLSGTRLLKEDHLVTLAKHLGSSAEHLAELFRKQSVTLRDNGPVWRVESSRDWEGLFRWVTESWDIQKLRELSQSAVTADEYDFADMINAVLRDRTRKDEQM